MSSPYLQAGDWGALIGAFVLVVVLPFWTSVRAFRETAFGSEQRYNDAQAYIAQQGCGGFILQSTGWLFGLQTVRNIGLTITWALYLATSPTTPDDPTSTFFCTTYILLNSLILSGAIFHFLTETFFWRLGWFATAFGLRIVEALVFIGALIVSAVELACLPADAHSGEEIALLIFLIIVVLHELFILVPRNWAFWNTGWRDDYARFDDDATSGKPRVIASSAQHNMYPQYNNLHQRAASAHK